MTDYFRGQLERTLDVLGIQAPEYMQLGADVKVRDAIAGRGGWMEASPNPRKPQTLSPPGENRNRDDHGTSQ